MYEFLEKMAAKKEKSNTLKNLGISGGAAAATAGGGLLAYKGGKAYVGRMNRLANTLKHPTKVPAQLTGGTEKEKALYKRLKSSKQLGIFNKIKGSKRVNKVLDSDVVGKLKKYLAKGNKKYYSLGALALLTGLGTYGGLKLKEKKNKK